jgi:hypothetical protein
MANLDPIPLSITAPEFDGLSGTWGCPRCEVPSGQVVRTVDLKSLWFWQPNSIGGQSGSAVVQKATQKGLLTWTWGGNGAGQLTETIYRQHVKQNTDGPARLDGLIPVTPVPAGLVLEEGYFSQSDLGNYPIWDNGNTNPDPDPSDPDCPPAVEPEDDEDVKRFKLLRDRFRDRGYNWVAILNLIFQLLEEFTKGR